MPGDSRNLYDAFLSHHSRDRAVIEAVGKWLTEEQGLRVIVDRGNLNPGEPADPEMEKALHASRCLVVFLDDRTMGRWQTDEAHAYLESAILERDVRLVPVLLPGISPDARQHIPVFFRRRLAVTFQQDTREAAGLQALAAAILSARDDGAAVSQVPPAAESASGPCPYRGLEPYREEDHPWFFGREHLIQQLLFRLHPSRLLAVLGPPRSGKTSVIQAGLLPELRAQNAPCVVVHPGEDPLRQLAEALLRIPPGPPRWKLQEVLEHLEVAGPPILGVLADEILHDLGQERMVLVVDPFEEVFTRTRDEARRQRFFKLLTTAARDDDSRLQFILSMRSDFLGECTRDAELDALICRNLVQVGPMSPAEVQSVVLGPAHRHQTHVDPKLPGLILADLRGEPSELPLLSHALAELFHNRALDPQRGTGMLSAEGYRQMGGLRGSIGHRADTTLARVEKRLGQAAAEISRKMFVLCLAQTPEAPGLAARRAPVGEVLRLSSDPAFMQSLLDEWIRSGLLVQDGAADSPTPSRNAGDFAVDSVDAPKTSLQIEHSVRVAHDLILDHWPRLRQWLTAHTDDSRGIVALRQEAHAWIEQGRPAGGVLAGSRLFDAEELAARVRDELPVEIVELIAASVRVRDESGRGTEQMFQRALKEAQDQLADAEEDRQTLNARILEQTDARRQAETDASTERMTRQRAERRARWFAVALVGVSTLALAAAWALLTATG